MKYFRSLLVAATLVMLLGYLKPLQPLTTEAARLPVDNNQPLLATSPFVAAQISVPMNSVVVIKAGDLPP